MSNLGQIGFSEEGNAAGVERFGSNGLAINQGNQWLFLQTSLTGTTLPVLSVTVSPASLSFGSQTQGTTSAAQTVTLTNAGTGAVSLSGISAKRRLQRDKHLRNVAGGLRLVRDQCELHADGGGRSHGATDDRRQCARQPAVCFARWNGDACSAGNLRVRVAGKSQLRQPGARDDERCADSHAYQYGYGAQCRFLEFPRRAITVKRTPAERPWRSPHRV